MKEAWVLDVEEAQIISQLDSDVKLLKDTMLGPFEQLKQRKFLVKFQVTIKEWM